MTWLKSAARNSGCTQSAAARNGSEQPVHYRKLSTNIKSASSRSSLP
jgi:hypothetical protein